MRALRFLTLFAACVLAASAFSGSDDKFIKKYAMMKIYESCFGPEVIQQIRDEMKFAVAKCAALELDTLDDSKPSPPPSTQKPTPEPVNVVAPVFTNTVPIAVQPLQQDTKGLLSESQIQHGDQPTNFIKGFDPEKLHQAILSYRPIASQNPFQPSLRPLQVQGSSYYPNGVFGNNPAAFGSPYSFYQGNPNFFNPNYPQFPPFLQNQQYFSNGRLSRDLDLTSQVESLKARLNGKVRNVTCVMQELGYLDNNLEPAYDKIIAKINSLTIQDELKKDIEDGIDFCKQFSQCIPESSSDKSPFSNVMMKPMFFFRCYKHKKLEACIMKDVRERFAGMSDDNIDNIPDQELFRRAKSLKTDSNEKTSSEELTTSIFDFLFGNESDLNEIL